MSSSKNPSDQELPDSLVEYLSPNLVSTTPRDGVEMYFEDRKDELEDSTKRAYRTSAEYFLEFCDQNDIVDLNDLNGRHLRDYHVWRRDESSDKVDVLSDRTERDEQVFARQLVKYFESIDAVEPNLHEKVRIPDLNDGDEVRDETISQERAQEIIDYLETYHYASLEHVTWLVLRLSGGRLGGARALDVGDVHLDTDEPYLAFTNRPETGTRLKNGDKGERHVNIWEPDVFEAYLDNQRPDVEDDHGRQPFLATNYGRIGRATIRKYVYKWSQPCRLSAGCPHGKNPTECPAAQNLDHGSKCPSSRSPHAIRRGKITQDLDQGIPIEVVSERCDVSRDVIDKHYDKRTEDQKRRRRREVYAEVYRTDSSPTSASNGGPADD